MKPFLRTFFRALLFSLVFLGALPAFAFQGAMGLRVSEPAASAVHSDFYVLGWSVTLNGAVDGDLFVLGGAVHVRGPVHGSVFLAGGSLQIDGPVDGDINLIGFKVDSKSPCRTCRILALTANQQGKTAKDMLAVGAIVNSNGAIQGDTLLAGEEVNAGGDHQGNFFAYSRHHLDILGHIKGDATLKGDTISLEKSAQIQGNVTYTSPHDMTGPVDHMTGQVLHRYPLARFLGPWHFSWMYLLEHKVFSAIWLTIVGMVVLTWFPRSAQSVVDTMLHFPWESFGFGLVLFVLVPGLAFLLMVSLLGIPLGIFLFGVFGIAVYLTRLFGSLYIGERLLGALEHHLPPYWQSLPLGVFLFTLLTSLPWIGLAFSLIVIPLAFGAKALLSWRVYRRMRSRDLA